MIYERQGRRFFNSAGCGEAGGWLKKSLAVWNGWSAHGVSSAFNTTKHKQAARAIAQCEAALAKISANPDR